MTTGISHTYSGLALAINLTQAAKCVDGGKVLGTCVVFLCIANFSLDCIM
jgi:hypothetical protein